MANKTLRIAIVGTTCSGKTTLAKQLGERFSIAHYDLDRIFGAAGDGQIEFQNKVASLCRKDSWIIDGNHAGVREPVWNRATHIIRLDYSFPLVFFRCVKRTLARFRRGTTRFQLRQRADPRSFRLRHTIFYWMIRSYFSGRRELDQLLQKRAHCGVKIISLRSRRETKLLIGNARSFAGFFG